MVYVAETEDKAIAEGRDHILFYFQKLLKTSPHFYAPPGHLPLERLRKRLATMTVQDTEVTWDLLTSLYRTVLGTPTGRGTDRVLVRAGAEQQDHPAPACRRHAALEGGKEHQPVRRGSDPAHPALRPRHPAGGRVAGRSWHGFAHRELVVRGVRVDVVEAGTGDPLVYLHGAGTVGGFDDLLPLSANRRLIVPIHPGFGASDDDPMVNSIVDYVVHYATLFDQLGITEPVDIVGHSLGGWIASMFAVLQGHRVRRLALACPAGLRVPDIRRRICS